MKEKNVDILQDNPLYAVLRGTPLEETLSTDTYLADIIKKKFYYTPEVAGSFNITDAQLRYYIKPFEHYTTALAPSDELASKVELLSNVLQQII